MSSFKLLLNDRDAMMAAIGDEDSQVEILTWMKHSLELHSDVLTPRELSLISVVFDTIVQRSGVVLGSLPEWFAISAEKWDKAHVSKIPEGEEKCLRTAAAWIELNHPNIRKLFGACHVIVVHERSTPYSGKIFSWGRILVFAHELE